MTTTPAEGTGVGQLWEPRLPGRSDCSIRFLGLIAEGEAMRKMRRRVGAVIASLACLALVLPPSGVRASQPAGGGEAAPASGIADVRLDERGLLRGKLVSTTGQPLATRPVVLQQAGGTACSTETDAAGGFVLRGVRAGVHRLVVDERSVACRVWTNAAAPPSAIDQLTVVAGPPLIRGQQPFSAVFTNPLFIGLVIAAAIAIPIAVHNAQNDHPSGS